MQVIFFAFNKKSCEFRNISNIIYNSVIRKVGQIIILKLNLSSFCVIEIESFEK